VMTREKTVVRQAELSILASPDEEGIVLVECKVAANLGSGYNMKSHQHLF